MLQPDGLLAQLSLVLYHRASTLEFLHQLSDSYRAPWRLLGLDFHQLAIYGLLGTHMSKKASNIPPEGMLLAFCTDIYLFLLTVLENILDRPQIFGIAQRHHVFDIRAEKSDVLQSFQLFFLQCHHK